MLIFAIDDEPKMLRSLNAAIEEARPDAEICAFSKISEVIHSIKEEKRKPDVVFTDIEMPVMSGIELAIKIKNVVPDARIIFVTSHSQYAVEAFRLHINGYILKPVDPERVKEELKLLDIPVNVPEPESKLRIKCFGYFDVFWQGKPLIFKRNQTKELLAYLVDREGAACTSEELITALWEDVKDDKVAKSHIRVLISDLRTTLGNIKMEGILIREKRMIAIKRDMIDCDYYRMLGGDVNAVNSYHGEYMKQYSWAEYTNAKLHFSDI
ncbi:Two-component response regulator, SAPR family, consists of REC, wHTH and BTAD domains [Eubacterium ruminantium]|jgi:two-component SAPR family response regulator|uniref:Stage 0 sporulation protein A homolog n=2 Tax=Eubacterium TaxID=1730 RepID=A0A1T4QBW5_9FIRM|nr:response regulator [Eubacterium ruminantium]SCW66971.1 Two-component response regulator, SAPR family, consists of REC, wHTH and BTAD domains [Eubacterium ruminantium]SDN35651.1 Two-component response regulator, SAPR family, consists of REC, wHTH and BTAD domains [Eubacterium ruminantium]SKA01031.1 Two-component response regulator, SAPR family, consists of REC, wHTH and BTAD domains [Eubacterium ruminantium]